MSAGGPIPAEEPVELFKFEDPFSGAVTRLVNWPEGLVLWHGGEIVWRAWGPKAAPAVFPTIGGDV